MSCFATDAASGQATVTASVRRQPPSSSRRAERPLPSAVLWLNPLQPVPAPVSEPAHPPYTLTQKDRMFTPHVLVVPVGTPVNFPNADPFFHNVFSLYNGKRFDLGLYEKGTNRQVVFNREGVSYLFCNIHPEMSAVVVAVDSTYFGVSDASGAVSIANVPAGRYEMHVWYERSLPEDLKNLTRVVRISDSARDLGAVPVIANPNFTSAHKNKYGEDYVPPPANGYGNP